MNTRTRAMVTVSLVFLLASPTPAATVLSPGQMLGPNESVYADGCQLVYQGDGNLVLYCGGQAQWASGTHGTSPGFVAMQTDGNLVVYDGSGTPQWNSSTSGYHGAYATISNNKLLVLSARGSWLWWSTVPPGWVPSACVHHLDAGLDAYDQGRVDLMCVYFENFYRSGCGNHPLWQAVFSVLMTCRGR